jgi:bacillolysin
MARSKTGGGVRVTRKSGAQVSPPRAVSPARARAAVRRSAAAARGRAERSAATTPDAVLIEALAQQELTATHALTITPQRASAARRGARKSAARTNATVDVAVDIGTYESAVILVEHNGEYSWHFPSPRKTPARRSARKSLAATSVTISVRLDTRVAPSATARRGARGPLIKTAKALVLKFIAKTAAGVAMKYLERNVRKGLVLMDGDDPAAWRRISHIDDLAELRDKEELRVLLWVHGTFSSTAGSFGALTATPDGRYLLQQAREKYDAVIGFDHATLSETPHENAVELTERLDRFRRRMTIDAITFSRGGLVFRSLVEQLLPASDGKPEVGQVVFVGVPNNGTLLAEPENWKTLVDFHTNLAVGAFNLMKLLPGAAPSAHILAEIVSGLGAFVKYLASIIVDDAEVPGLAAMRPNGPFLRALNKSGPDQPLPESCRYLAVTSSFDAQRAFRNIPQNERPTGLAGSFLGRLADGLVDQLIGEANDLVVNTGSMKQIDPESGDYIDAALDFARSPTVYHTVYFAQGGVAQQLRGWLMDEEARAGFRERRGLLRVAQGPNTPFMRMRFHETDGRRGVKAEQATRKRAPRKSRIDAEEPVRNTAAANKVASKHLTRIFGVRSATEPMRAKDMKQRPGAKKASAIKRIIQRAGGALGVGKDLPRARAYAPALATERVQTSRLTDNRRVRVVSFQQTHRKIPIFGSRAIVEIDQNDNMLAARARLGRVYDVSPKPKLSAKKALAGLWAQIDELSKEEAKDVAKRNQDAPLTFFYNRRQDKWHLAYVVSDVPARPKPNRNGKRKAHPHRHGKSGSPRERFPHLDYLIDAHTGKVCYSYSITPNLSDLPVEASGRGELGPTQKFFTRRTAKGVELNDPFRNIRTFDMKMADVDNGARPARPIIHSGVKFGAVFRPAVSAHVNVTRVFQFYNDVLLRKGVDGRGSVVRNYVNCLSLGDEDPPTWGNAIWYRNCMWYGQVMLKNGQLQSVAASLDVVGHELTHGVIEHTCDLVYRDESGALNESFADIFGVIIKNRNNGTSVYNNPSKWDWEIGSGFGEDGKPWRSMKNPALTGDPEHTSQMDDYDQGDLEADDGGVHYFSNIHNKAAYNLLTKRRKGRLVFKPDEVARLYYFTMQRLDRTASFEDVLETLVDVAKSVYQEPADQARRLDAIRAAYTAVGIPRNI